MARYLLGVLVVTAGVVALASAARGNLPSNSPPASGRGNRLRESETVTASGACRTWLRPLPRPDMSFSLN